MPLNIWANGQGTSRPWFSITDGVFRPTFEVEAVDRPAFADLTAELVALRLKEHLDRLRNNTPLGAEALPFVLKVSHSNHRPILRFDRNRQSDLPVDDVDVVVDGRPYIFQFRKIACYVVVEQLGGTNVLPALLRGWLGPTAGLPGTRHSVELVRRDDHWVLQRGAAGGNESDVSASPKLPFFPELKVACGAFGKTDRLSEVTSHLVVNTDRDVEPTRNFLVRASGGSMNGGDHPVQDGDLVLCEWWKGGSTNEIAGIPMLILGHYDTESSFAAMKVPLRRGDSWVLHSWNPDEVDQELPTGASVEPVARVLGVVEEARGLIPYAKYSRDDIAHAFGTTNNPSWRVGHRDITVGPQAHTILMVDLRKNVDTKVEYRYADVFLSREEFQWESQASTTPTDAKGRRIVGHEKEGRLVHLFARYNKRGDDFVYCGTMTYVRHEGEKPMRVWWTLGRPLPESLWKAWAL